VTTGAAGAAPACFTSPAIRGSHSVSSGMSVMATSDASSGTSQGRIAMVVRSTDLGGQRDASREGKLEPRQHETLR
jgi:hypothetical protein